MIQKSLLVTSFIISIFLSKSVAQQQVTGQDTSRNVITTAVPFLTISPDARSAGMGDVGAAISGDANAIYWNAAKLAFQENKIGISFSYTPWLAQLINDMSISYLAGTKKLNEGEVIGASLKYFDLGEIQLTDQNGGSLGDFNPHELALDAVYSRRLFENFSVAVGGRFIYSNLTGQITNNPNSVAKAGITGAADLSMFGRKEIAMSGKPAMLTYGLSITNIGAKLTYSSAEQRDFIPTNFRIGTALTTELDPYNKLTFALDANKLMVPTPGAYNNQKVSVLKGWFGSFSDAPGGFNEEMKELIFCMGAEYFYNNVFAARTGYFYENEAKGNRKYFTFGLGLRYKDFIFDVAYLIPRQQQNPLADTLRFTIGLNLGQSKVQTTTSPVGN
jgi:hypothetical protein